MRFHSSSWMGQRPSTDRSGTEGSVCKVTHMFVGKRFQLHAKGLLMTWPLAFPEGGAWGAG